MSDPLTPTVAPTDATTTGVNPTPAIAPVNPAQAPTTTPTQPQDVSGIIASYEARIRNLMSDKDKALNERNQAISQLSELQKTYTTEKEQTSNSLTNTANAAQSAIDQTKRDAIRMQQLEAELLRAQTLLADPELSPYVQFIPATNDPQKLQEAVTQLKQIRQQDIERYRSSGQSPTQQQQTNGTPNLPAVPAIPGQPLAAPLTGGQANQLYGLYSQRNTMNPSVTGTIPGSNPAQMHPAGAIDPTTSIQQMLLEALNSGDSAKYQTALEQAKLLAQPIIAQQLSR